MTSYGEWQQDIHAMLAVLLEDARSGVLEADWRISWADRIAEVIHVAEGTPWFSGLSIRMWAVEPDTVIGFDHRSVAERLMLVLRELAESPVGDYWDWEPARSVAVDPERSLRAWWAASIALIDADEEAAWAACVAARGPALNDVMASAEREARVRAHAQRRRDLLTESVAAAGRQLVERGLVYGGLGRVRMGTGEHAGVVVDSFDRSEWDDWVEASRQRVQLWSDEKAATEHLEKLTDPAYRERLEHLPDYWLSC